jgi:hypothetical protein
MNFTILQLQVLTAKLVVVMAVAIHDDGMDDDMDDDMDDNNDMDDDGDGDNDDDSMNTKKMGKG